MDGETRERATEDRAHVPCPHQSAANGYACQRPRGHDGMHHASGPGYSINWQGGTDA
jgi:hypothetical protein